MRALLGAVLLAAILPATALADDGDRYGDVTFYNDCCITASGTHVRRGVAACPRDVPFGTYIDVDQLGTFICEDRGGAIVGDNLDIWVPSYQEAITNGRMKLHWRIFGRDAVAYSAVSD